MSELITQLDYEAFSVAGLLLFIVGFLAILYGTFRMSEDSLVRIGRNMLTDGVDACPASKVDPNLKHAK
jgi:hypothetical protein